MYTTGVSIGGFVDNIYLLLVIRGIQGLGIAMFPIALNIVRGEFPRDKIAIGQGFITSMFAAGTVIGLLIGANIIHLYGWRFTYFSIAPIAVILTILIYRLRIREEVNNNNSIDYLGALTLAIAIGSFLLALTYIDENHNLSLTLAFISISAFISFIIREKRVKEPLVNFIIFKGALLPANIIVMLVGFCMFLIFQTIPILVDAPKPYGLEGSILDIAYTQLPFAIILLIFGPTSGFIVTRIGSIKAIITGIGIVTLGFISLLTLHNSINTLTLGLAIIAVGLALINVGITNIIALVTDRRYLGIGFGMHTLIRVIGSSTGPVVAGVFMQIGLDNGYPSSIAYNNIFLTAVIVSFIMIALSIKLRSIVIRDNNKV
ncbi:MAG: MFS transporter [Candidatus Nitrosothermus koennekii]|nr:MAG: MFS transporter [Candidatus Nitrosothermus koennekii]